MTLPVDALLAALEASPDNAALRAIVAQACVDADDVEPLRRALARFGGDLFADDGVRARAIERLRAADAHALADTLADTPEALLAHARLALGDGRRDEARDAYERAIARNPALEDRALAAELEGRVVSLASARRPVASVSNDDTGDADVVRLVQPQVARQTFADVGGLDAVKEQIRRRIITPFLKPSLFERFKRRAGGGILMYGPPGCGKTLLARATAGECGARFFNVAINDVLDMYIGESERKLHALFEQARSAAPAVLFFDEVEALGGKRQHAREATSAKLVSQFLTELDGFAQANQGVLILGATNVPWAVDPAFRRPGRFDRVLFVPPAGRRCAARDPRAATRGPAERWPDRRDRARAADGGLLRRRPAPPRRIGHRRSDRVVDHFRPGNAVDDAAPSRRIEGHARDDARMAHHRTQPCALREPGRAV
jgi:SpoVK/Ycf46/Vps4 family AAA+-type ATPase